MAAAAAGAAAVADDAVDAPARQIVAASPQQQKRYLLIVGFGFVAEELARVTTTTTTTTTAAGSSSSNTKAPWAHVLVLVRSAERARDVLSKASRALPVVGDILDDANDANWRSVVGRATWIVQAAQPSLWERDYAQTRIRMERNVLYAVDTRVCERIVFVGGSSFFGRVDSYDPIRGAADETMQPRRPPPPSKVFETVAAMIEQHAARLTVADRQHDDVPPLNYAIAHVGAVYGHGSWFLKYFEHRLEQKKPIVMSDPAPLWPFQHVHDVARALHLLLVTADPVSQPAPQRTDKYYIVSNPRPESMRDFVNALAHAKGLPPPRFVADKAGVSAQKTNALMAELGINMNLSGAKLARLGFVPLYPTLRSGMAQLFPPKAAATAGSGAGGAAPLLRSKL